MENKNKKQLITALLAFILTFSNTVVFKNEKYYINDNNRIEVDTNDKLKQLGKEYYEFYDKYLVKYSNPEYSVSNLDVYCYKKQARTSNNCDYKYSGTAREMIDIIKNNNKKYMTKKSKVKYLNALDLDKSYKGSFKQRNYGMVVCHIYSTFLSEITKLMNNKLLGNNNEDLCKMKDLKVLIDVDSELYDKDGSVTYGRYFNKDNVIIIYLNSFLYEQIKDGKPVKKDINTYKAMDFHAYIELEKTVVHELNHMRQFACKDRTKQSKTLYKNIGASIIEATAESALYDEESAVCRLETYEKDNIYASERNFVNDLLLMTVTDNTTTIDDFYTSIFNSNPQAFIKYFNLKSNHDIRAFLNILNRYDAKKLRNNIAYNIGRVNKETEYAYYKAENIVGNDYKIDLLRLSLRNLIDYNIESNSELELEEIMMLEKIMLYQACDDANIFKTDKNGQLLKNKSGYFESTYDKNFINQLLELENKFNTYIMKNYDITPEELLVVSNRAENILKYPKRGDVYDASTISIVKNLSEKFPKFKFIVSRMGDRLGDNYKNIKKVYRR